MWLSALRWVRKNEALLAVTIDEKRGSFKQFCASLGGRAITEFNYRYAGPGEARNFCWYCTASRVSRT